MNGDDKNSTAFIDNSPVLSKADISVVFVKLKMTSYNKAIPILNDVVWKRYVNWDVHVTKSDFLASGLKMDVSSGSFVNNFKCAFQRIRE